MVILRYSSHRELIQLEKGAQPVPTHQNMVSPSDKQGRMKQRLRRSMGLGRQATLSVSVGQGQGPQNCPENVAIATSTTIPESIQQKTEPSPCQLQSRNP